MLSLDPSSRWNCVAPWLGDFGTLQFIATAEARPVVAATEPAHAGSDPFEAHRAQVASVLPAGDASAIKGLYSDLGELLENAYAENPDDVPVLSLPETAPVVSALLNGVDGLLLDAGCGPNPALSIALGRGAGVTVVAMDIGPATVRLARTVAARAGVGLLAVVGDLEHLPFRSDAFAGGVCDDTIEHVPDDDAAVAELARVLRPGGRLALATPNRHSADIVLRKVRDRLGGVRNPASHYFVATSHLREYTWAEAERLISPHLRLRSRAAVGWNGGRTRRLASAVTRLPGGHRLGRMVLLEVEPR
jgi:SAM-dependent methyltransferase